MVQERITAYTPDLTATGDDADVKKAVATALIELANEQIKEQQAVIAKKTIDLTYKQTEKSYREKLALENIAIEELQNKNTRLANRTAVRENIWYTWGERSTILTAGMEEEQFNDVAKIAAEFEAELSDYQEKRDKV